MAKLTNAYDIFSVLDYLKKSLDEGNTDLRYIILEIANTIQNNEKQTTNLPYNRRDAYSILEYLKIKAEQLSNGTWTDFSDSDIGTVFLKLMSYLADMNNFHMDKGISELYIDTAIERSDILAICKEIGYEPRHYESAHTQLKVTAKAGEDIPDGTVIPKYATFTDITNSIIYTNIEPGTFISNTCYLDAYEGQPAAYTYGISDITTDGKIILDDYNIAINTVQLTVNSQDYTRVDDVRFISGELGFSVHMSDDKYLYIQLPAFWPDVITQGSVIKVNYLLSSGEAGRIGKNVLTRLDTMPVKELSSVNVTNPEVSLGGYNPETVNELRDSIPKWARTMNTIVTINDFKEVASKVNGISDVVVLDYNDEASGYIQPKDYYKVKLYALPEEGNVIIKPREDWTMDDINLNGVDKQPFYLSDIDIDTRRYNLGTGDIILNELNTQVSVDGKLSYYSTTEDATKLTYYIVKDGNNYYIQFPSNYTNFITSTSELFFYLLGEQVLTEKGNELRAYIDQRRLTTLQITYCNVDILQPVIKVDIFMDQYDLRYDLVPDSVKNFIFKKYYRGNLKIGDPLFQSTIGADILDEFPYIEYCEVTINDTNKIEPRPREFVDILNDDTHMIVTMHPYTKKK